jgi:integrase
MMGRPRTGTVAEFRDRQKRVRYKVGITLPDGVRTWRTLPPGTSVARARATAASWSERSAADPVFQPGAGEPPAGETVAAWLVRWEADRHARGLQTRGTVGTVLKFLDATKDRPIAAITTGDLEAAVERADANVRSGSVRKWKTAQNAWGLAKKAFDDACHCKTLALRVRSDNPAAGVRGPDRGERTAKQYLYPSEFLALVSCERVPVRWGRIFALASYLYVRAGELEALEWEDIDLKRGIVNVHRAVDRQRGGTKATKTDTPRRFPIEPALLPLLQAMHDERDGTGAVVAMPPMEDWAQRLRKYLGEDWAGVTRAELFANDATRKQITFYDLRATGITWRAVRGDDPLKIMSGAGHRDFRTTQGYIREAEMLRDGFGSAFPALPARLLRDEFRSAFRSSHAQVRATIASPAGFEPGKAQATAAEAGESKAPEVAVPATASNDPTISTRKHETGSEPDPVEAALAAALEGATRAGQWSVVAQLARELEARRQARAGVVDLARERAKR